MREESGLGKVDGKGSGADAMHFASLCGAQHNKKEIDVPLMRKCGETSKEWTEGRRVRTAATNPAPSKCNFKRGRDDVRMVSPLGRP